MRGGFVADSAGRIDESGVVGVAVGSSVVVVVMVSNGGASCVQAQVEALRASLLASRHKMQVYASP